MSDTLTTTNIFSLFDTNKAKLVDFARDIVERLENGEGDGLKVLKQVKAMNEVIDTLTVKNEKLNKHYELAKRFGFMIALEHKKYPGKAVEVYGAKFEEKEVGVKYDYSKCGDPVWSDLDDQMKLLKEDMSTREAFLKTLPLQGVELRFDDELITLYPPAKSSTTTVTCTIK